MYRILRKIKLLFINLLVDIYCLIYKRKNQKFVVILSCDEWKNKVIEDIRLKYYLARNNIKSKIVSWEQEFDYSNCDLIIIRSIWGFDYKKFSQWINTINKKTKILNTYEIIKSNFSKEEQYNLLDENFIKHIETKYLKYDNNIIDNVIKIWENNYLNYEKIVIKPSISESGNKTYVLSKTNSLKNSIDLKLLKTKFNSVESTLMIQPFIEEISNGEISIIAFDKKISHAVVRYPGIFSNYNKVEEIDLDSLPKKIIEITNQILNLKAYKQHAYMRIDFVKTKEEFLVLEIELIDPILFINCIKNKNERKNVYFNFVNKIIKEIN